MVKKRKNPFKVGRRSQVMGAVPEINKLFACDLREDNWPEVIRAKAAEIWSPGLAENLRSYVEAHRDKLDFEWAKLYLLFCKEVLIKREARRVLQRADPLSKYPPCYTVQLEVADIYRTIEGKLRQAKRLYEELIKIDLRLPYANHYLGLVLTALGIYERAGEEFRRAIEAGVESEPEVKARAHYNLGVYILGYYRRDFHAMQRHLEEALRWMPEYPQAKLMLNQLKVYGHPYINEPQAAKAWSVKSQPTAAGGRASPLRLLTYWFPTEEAALRSVRLRCECWANQPMDAFNGWTPYEAAIAGRSVREILETYGFTRLDAAVRKYYEEVLPVDQGALSYKQVYRSTGGLLNLFNEPVGEEDDLQLQTLIKDVETSSDPRAARKRAITLWREEPNELFSQLTPAQVWAGGGATEMELAEQFEDMLTKAFDGKPFSSKGEMITQSIGLLRQWLLTPANGKEGPSRQELIIEESNAILKRKIEMLKSRGLLESSFLA